MKIKFLKAYNGDSIHLHFTDNDGYNRNIIIDGGTSETYVSKNIKGKQTNGELKEAIGKIVTRGEIIDLLIISHVDDDHIDGIKKWFSFDEKVHNHVKEVWFNTGQMIANNLNKPLNKDLYQYYKQANILETSISKSIELGEFIAENNIGYNKLIEQGITINRFGLKFQILSPDRVKLEKLLTEWKKVDLSLDTATRTSDYSKTLKELIENDFFKEDNSITNGSSIAFLLTYNEKKILFLSDAHPTVVIEGLKKFGYSSDKPVDVDYVKIPHHGSKNNMSDDLFKLVHSKLYICSTNGRIHQHPDKQLIARIIKNVSNCDIFFNYEERMNMVFSDQDKKDYPEFKYIAKCEFEI